MPIDLGNPVADHPLCRGLAAWFLPLPSAAAQPGLRDLRRGLYAAPFNGSSAGLGPYPATGPAGGVAAWTFDGTDDHARVANHPLLQATAATTCAFWAWLRSAPLSGNQYIGNVWSDEESTGGQSSIWRIGSQGQDALKQRVGINFFDSADHDTQSSSDVSLQTWTHVCVTTDGTNARFYLNGRLDASPAYAITPRASTNPNWLVGAYSTLGGRPFPGVLADLSYWPARCLAADDVWAWYDQSRRGHPDTLRRWSVRAHLFSPAAAAAFTWQPPAESRRPDRPSWAAVPY